MHEHRAHYYVTEIQQTRQLAYMSRARTSANARAEEATPGTASTEVDAAWKRTTHNVEDTQRHVRLFDPFHCESQQLSAQLLNGRALPSKEKVRHSRRNKNSGTSKYEHHSPHAQ